MPRMGINATMADHHALVRLLVAKGVFTLAEYRTALKAEERKSIRGERENLT